MEQQPFRLPAGGLIDRTKPARFTFEGQQYAGFEGDTLASALLASGVRIIAKSKSGRPRGIFGISNSAGAISPSLSGGDSPASRPDQMQKCARFDVAVIGGGAAGIVAALTASSTGARTILIEQSHRLGGWLLCERQTVDHKPAQIWVQDLAQALFSRTNVEVRTQTPAFAIRGNAIFAWDQNRAGEGSGRIEAKAIVLATGECEKPLHFEDDDRPGVMLAGAVRGYLNRYGVACGRRVLIATNNDLGYLTAFDLVDAGVEVAGVADERPLQASFVLRDAMERGIMVLDRARILKTIYGDCLKGAEVLDRDGYMRKIECDCIAVTGGLGGAARLAGGSPVVQAAGACAGAFALRICLGSAAQAGAAAAIAAGYPPPVAWIAPRAAALLNTRRVTGIPGGRLVDPRRVFADSHYDLAAEANPCGCMEARHPRPGDRESSALLYDTVALGLSPRRGTS